MNNLLRTLTQTELSSDLRLLLQNVKDQRSGDKVEPFYEAIESVLAELRASTFDNHDADAFLRPVSKTDFPDYTTIITDPMDFGTMQKKARAKAYRSKAEFNADLEKIWRNCYMYNTTEGHHLHKCVERLKIKARRLLANITDRRERSDPAIPTPKRKGMDAPVFRLNLAPPQRTIRGLEGMPPRTGEGMAQFLRREAGIEPLSPEPVDEAGERPRKRIKLEEGVEAVEDPDEWWNIMRTPDMLVNGVPPTFKPKRPRRRKARAPTPNGNGMLKLMNNNIRTIKRLRRTNAKFGALSEEVQDEPDVVEVDDPPEDVPWPTPSEVDERSGEQCLRWMGTKVLEHAGFQGTTKSTLDVLASVASDYLYNVGRTIKFLCDKHGSTMSPEEIILHTLFESGVTRIQDLERYVRDDVERYGVRLGELENKIVGAYREAASGGITGMDDEAMFEDDDEEDVGILALGDFADAVGVDYLGLRELGIAEELGLSNLTIPKKLLRRRRNNASAPVRTASPPPLYPPPPPLLPLTVDQIPDQIGLLQPLYKAKIQPSGIGFPMLLAPGGAPLQPPVPPGDAPLPDEVPAPAQMKMGPLGQIGATGAQSKKANDKKKEKEAKEKGKEKKERVKEVNGVNGNGEGEPPAKTKSKKKKKVTLDPQMEQMQGVIAPVRG